MTNFASPLPGADEPDWKRWLDHVEVAADFQVAGSRPEFEAQRQQVRAKLWELMGRLPPRPAVPRARVLSVEDKGTYTIERFEFDNEAGATVPGMLFLPKHRPGRLPGIVWNHWHGGQHDVGIRQVLVSNPNFSPHAPGPRMAQLGYAVVAIDSYCFGDRNGRGPGGPAEKGSGGELTAAKFHLWAGRTLWGMMVRDDMMAVDYLSARPEVDPARIGATGLSMGATRTWWLMAMDDRIKAGVAVCCLTRYRELIEDQLLKGHGIYYYVPGMLNHFDTEAVIACIAPRAFLSLAGELDASSAVRGIKKIEAAARPAWQLWDRSAAFRSVIEPGVGHIYTPTMWEQMEAWFAENL